MYAFLVNRVAQQMGREASSILQTAQLTGDQPLSAPAPEVAPEFTVDDFLSQVPPPAPAPSMPFDLSEEVLDIAALDEAEMAAEAALPTTGNLEALHQELDRLDLAPLSADTSDVNGDQFAADLFSGDQPLPPPLVGQAELATPPAVADDFDSALDLLNQLSAEMQLDPSLVAIPEVSRDRDSSVPMAGQPAPAEFVSTLDSLYGDDTSLEAAPPSTFTEAVDATTLAEEWFGGLGDPAAPAQPAVEPARPQFSDGSVSQSLESFLRNDAPLSVPEADFVIQEREAAPVEAPETISSFFDLLPESVEPSPELPIQEAAPDVDGVDLGDSLQDFQRDFPVTESPIAHPVLEGGWEVFSDLPTAASHPASGLPAPSTPPPAAQPPAVPVENLDNLFADVPDLNASTPVPSPAQVLSDLFAQFQPNSADSDPSDSEKKN